MSEKDSDISNADIPLADMIQRLRDELEEALRNAEGKEITFKAEKVELELKVAIVRRKKGQSGIDFYVKLGGELEKSDEIVHNFKLTLVPQRPDGAQVNVSKTTAGKQSNK